jgi:hypothetical protein
MTVLKQAYSILQDAKTITSDLYGSLFLQSLLQHGWTSHAKDAYASDTTADDRSEWQQFLDNLCFVCDSKPAGQSVVSIGVEEGRSGAVFWVATAKRHQEEAERHLKESLRLLVECSLGVMDGNLAMAEIARLSVERSQDRVTNYVKRLERLIVEESTRHKEEMHPEGKISPPDFSTTEHVLTRLKERACDPVRHQVRPGRKGMLPQPLQGCVQLSIFFHIRLVEENHRDLYRFFLDFCKAHAGAIGPLAQDCEITRPPCSYVRPCHTSRHCAIGTAPMVRDNQIKIGRRLTRLGFTSIPHPQWI